GERQRSRPGDDTVSRMPTAQQSDPESATEPWTRRVIRVLLYGKNVDRAAKSRARVGLAIVGFAAIYAIIAVRLVIFAVTPEGHAARRMGNQDAVATARPAILDPTRQLLPTAPNQPSPFSPPPRLTSR